MVSILKIIIWMFLLTQVQSLAAKHHIHILQVLQERGKNRNRRKDRTNQRRQLHGGQKIIPCHGDEDLCTMTLNLEWCNSVIHVIFPGSNCCFQFMCCSHLQIILSFVHSRYIQGNEFCFSIISYELRMISLLVPPEHA